MLRQKITDDRQNDYIFGKLIKNIDKQNTLTSGSLITLNCLKMLNKTISLKNITVLAGVLVCPI